LLIAGGIGCLAGKRWAGSKIMNGLTVALDNAGRQITGKAAGVIYARNNQLVKLIIERHNVC